MFTRMVCQAGINIEEIKLQFLKVFYGWSLELYKLPYASLHALLICISFMCAYLVVYLGLEMPDRQSYAGKVRLPLFPG